MRRIETLSGAMHRQIGRILALEDAIDITGRVAILVKNIGRVGKQPPEVTNGRAG